MSVARLLGTLVLLATLAGFGALASAEQVNGYFIYVVNLTLINAIAAIGLVIVSGAAGQMSLGTSALLAIGAYATGMLTTHFGVPWLAAAIVGAFAATVIGTLLAAPALRLTGLHLAIVTLAFGVIVVQLIGKGGKWTGGMSGLTLAEADLLGFAMNTEARRYWVIAGTFFAVALSASAFLRRKPGRALLALREREPTARALGIDVARYKTLAFAYSSFLAGLAGALYAPLKGYISVDDFNIWQSIYFFVMIAVGGMTSIAGGVLGAIVVTVLPEALRGLQDAANAVFGILLMLIIIFLPGGLVSLGQPLRRLLPGRAGAGETP
ncbi:branched-chain amino acid ABC transporter permease [Bosea sp. (in: a-proteobacteria)]|uniref:branched-chain amino acid ABC transporter permease n=1 Tax=Bosea sp. (in: a-proteobacteria) TaxID=1871050 RepID=UPI00263040FE|nr:branched-chain amino acid ABC transporter permease [Bosea sp. (in: a-proteobacteria)]MCO5089663.1 branched-chain amino acid ABC transporter permease [Bosea sp. (in: a-proteobacteria)]